MTLYVSDLDGTLLSSTSHVSARSAELLTRLSAEGARITVATARTPATVDPLLADTRLQVPAIVMTGAARWNLAERCYSHCRFMSAEEVEAVLRVCGECGVVPLVYTLPEDTNFLQVYHGAEALTEVEALFVSQRSHLPLKRMNMGTALPAELRGRVLLQFALGPEDAIRRVARAVDDVTGCTVSCYTDRGYPGTGLMEVFAPGVSKAAAIRELADELGADRLVVYGDNLNDLSMMAVADVAVAVENAFPAALEAADVVIGPNDSDSVALHIAADFGER